MFTDRVQWFHDGDGRWLVASNSWRPVFVVIALLMFLGGIWLVMWTISSAHINFLACPDGFSLSSEQPECRRPKVLELSAIGVILGAIIASVIAIRTKPKTKVSHSSEPGEIKLTK